MGLDVAPTVVVQQRKTPDALAFDGLSKDFILDAEGNYTAAHPVDAKVFMICRVALGSLRSAPDTGQNVSAQQYLDPLTTPGFVRDDLKVRCAEMVESGQMRIDRVDVELRNHGGVFFALNYTNLVTGKRRTLTPAT
jgi:hypothetical protein